MSNDSSASILLESERGGLTSQQRCSATMAVDMELSSLPCGSYDSQIFGQAVGFVAIAPVFRFLLRCLYS